MSWSNPMHHQAGQAGRAHQAGQAGRAPGARLLPSDQYRVLRARRALAAAPGARGYIVRLSCGRALVTLEGHQLMP
jgi:hypothetical protein